MEQTHHLTITEQSGHAIHETPIETGVPLPQGWCYNHKELALTDIDGQLQQSEITVLTLWPDNSIKWCLVRALVSLDAHASKTLSLSKRKHQQSEVHCNLSCVSDSENEIAISTSQHQYVFNKKTFNLFDRVSCADQPLLDRGSCKLITSGGISADAIIDEIKYQKTPASHSLCPLACGIQFTGHFEDADGSLLAGFECELTFYIKSETVSYRFTIHNPKPAKHLHGQWDLGDPNSLFFKGIELSLNWTSAATVKYRLETGNPWQQHDAPDLCIYQASSGGTHWDSTVHKNHENTVPLEFSGYTCSSSASKTLHGQRATPAINLGLGSGQVYVQIEDFWQNFPKALQLSEGTLDIGLFPNRFKAGFELQPGEKKTHRFQLCFKPDEAELHDIQTPPSVTLNPEWIAQTGALPYNAVCNENNGPDLAIQGIINQGLVSDSHFFAKREMIDEYGWRNFGDIYADHETDTYNGDELFISHYNNQYDPVYGFLRQYLLTANPAWFTLADDLAKHVIDIDIYHTVFDKEEYNGGLFWHTDHYLKAETSSHRSYSRLQDKNVYTDHAGGGGPGGQHCYTTGLLYHYLLTGNEQSRQAIFQLADWITHVYEYDHSGRILDVLVAIKNRHRIDLKNLLTGKYPLDRGTANYINALLDKYELTQQRSILDRVQHIIENTVHPRDDIEQRDLLNAEISWYYTVFFQATSRYLYTKETLGEIDDAFYYVRDCLLHYANWMAQNESPYLTHPGKLEFPNHTWTAQDIRKVNVLYIANYYSPSERRDYLDKADQILDYIVTTLKDEPTRTYTRILAILMQNHGVIAYYRNKSRCAYDQPRQYPPQRRHGIMRSLINISSALIYALANFSPGKELDWLVRRSDRIARLVNFSYDR